MKENTKLQTLGLLLLPFLLVGGLRLWALSRQPAHLEQIAAEIGSIPQFRVALHPNYSGSALLFFRETETGLGTYFCETATGKTRLLYEEKEKSYRNNFRLLGWSPDDSIMAFAIMPDDRDSANSGVIVLCKGLTGEVITKIPAGGIAKDVQFIWLSAHAFVYSTYTHRSWLLYAQQPDGSWMQTQVVKRFAEGRLANVLPISENAIAWQNKQTIWTYDFHSGAMEHIWESTTNKLISFEYSAASGNLLLRCKDAHGGHVAEFRPPHIGVNTNGSIVKVTRPIPTPPHVSVPMKDGRFFITIEGPSAEKPNSIDRTTVAWDGMLFSLDGALQYSALVGENLYFAASQQGGIPEIWEYNVKSQKFRQVTSSLQTPLKRAKLVEPIVGVYTNKGQKMTYHLWPPVNKVQGKKYPVVITPELHNWHAFQQAAPNVGWFYAHLDITAHLDHPGEYGFAWPGEVAGLYRALADNADIDTNKVLFIARSAQTTTVNELLHENIGIQYGFVLDHPVGGPVGGSLPGLRAKSVLMLGGSDDGSERVASLEDNVFSEGNSVGLLLQDGVQHLTRSISSERQQTIQFARFLSQNR